MKSKLTWGESYMKVWSMGEHCTFLGCVLWTVLSTIFVTFMCVINSLAWTFAAIVAFVFMSLARVFIRFEYIDAVAGMCLWWLDHVQEGIEA